jgi:hypothetical protein
VRGRVILQSIRHKEPTMSRTSRGSFTVVAVVIALLAPVASNAQFGSLKKKMKDKITGDPQPATPATPAPTPTGDPDAKARQEAWQHPVAISASTLDGFIKAIKAENAERAKYVAAAPPTSAIGRWNAYLAEGRKCSTSKLSDDSTQTRLQRQMMAEATAGHGENIQKYTDSMTALSKASQERSQRCSALARPELGEEDYKAVHAQEDKEEAAGAAAGGLPPFVYARLKERVIAYTLMPTGWQPSGYSPEELKLLDARRAELKPIIGRDFNSSGQRNPIGS